MGAADVGSQRAPPSPFAIEGPPELEPLDPLLPELDPLDPLPPPELEAPELEPPPELEAPAADEAPVPASTDISSGSEPPLPEHPSDDAKPPRRTARTQASSSIMVE
jgi:hypothetical protein